MDDRTPPFRNESDCARTAAAAHYVIARARPEALGATKLNKVLWFADIAAYRRLGQTVTRETAYRKQQFGPCPQNIVLARRKLLSDGLAIERTANHYGRSQKQLVSVRQPDLSDFTAAEIDILNEAIRWVCDEHTATSISDLTHDPLWQGAEMDEAMPIGAASVLIGEPAPEDLAWAQTALQ